MGFWDITVKDLYLILKDRGASFTLLALPAVFIAILGMSTGQLLTTRDELKLIKIGLIDEDQTDLSRRVFEDLSTIGGMKVERVTTRAEGKLRLQDGRSGVIVTLGKDFHNRVEELSLGDVFDPEHGKLSQGVSSLDMEVDSGAAFVGVGELLHYVMLSAVMKIVAPEVARQNPVISRIIERTIERHREEAEAASSAATTKAVKSGSSIVYQTLVPAFIVMFAYFLVNIMASSFISERSLGTLRRMQISRLSPAELLLGKTLPFLLVSIIQSCLLFLSGKLLFGMSWGHYPWMLVPVLLATAMSATGLGLLIATMIRTESQVASYSTFVVVVLAGISGCYMPRDWLPTIMQKVSLATPHAWALIAYQELLTRDQPDMPLVWSCCGVLALFGIAGFMIGTQRFRAVEYPS